MTKDKQTIRILLAEDQEVIRLGLKMIFQTEADLKLVGVTTDVANTILQCHEKKPDVILFDCLLHEGHCLDRIPEVLNAYPSGKILIMTACQSPKRHLQGLRNGAVGIFLLNQPITMLLRAIRKVHSGEVWIPYSLAIDVLKELNNFDTTRPDSLTTREPVKIPNPLTPRERTIAQLVASGMSVKHIAAKLYISEKTVRNHLVIVYSKLGVHNHIELMMRATPLGLRASSI